MNQFGCHTYRKNICESIIGTLLNINEKKIKDGINSCKNLEDMEIRHELHPRDHGSKIYLPIVLHTLSESKKRICILQVYTHFRN